MRSDNFTKAALAVIAINLSLLTSVQLDLIPIATARSSVLQGIGDPGVPYGLVPLNEDGSISVRLRTGDEIDVNITDISTSDELNVNIDEIGGGYIRHGGPLPVKIEQ